MLEAPFSAASSLILQLTIYFTECFRDLLDWYMFALLPWVFLGGFSRRFYLDFVFCTYFSSKLTVRFYLCFFPKDDNLGELMSNVCVWRACEGGQVWVHARRRG